MPDRKNNTTATKRNAWEKKQTSLPSDSPSVEQPAESSRSICLANVDILRAHHSSPTATSVFTTRCWYCHQYFKNCMFTTTQLKSGTPDCKSCRYLRDPLPSNPTPTQTRHADEECSIHLHLDCNNASKSCKNKEEMPLDVLRATVSRIQGQVVASGKTIGVELGGVVAGRWEEEDE